ncbi:serine hydrolase domain-containing protein [Streptomyces pseudovenezuelae]|uniref:CubicO group peptidase (Beta-lactamase class C family) n=1 Tax=Streptomyces pseudovenezuelae TaxID=67350 RepID=A0ABT6LVK9_9ACTN|nr:serine hydrolase domain-containing protein [Streptomyces pseudovenezuelae]MDH6220356.1 CubicO group peptidase (beta-lactamase class C family) [Streptomyces pseudovenezuelae]
MSRHAGCRIRFRQAVDVQRDPLHVAEPVTMMTSLQQKVQSVLDELVDTGAETGLQVAVHHRGVLVVDAVAGLADSRTGRRVTPETPFFSFSAGKVMTSLIAHLLVRTGAVGYDTPVVDLWPEFGARGKESATLRHVLTHSVGVPAMPRGIGPADLTDWSRVCTAIADAEPRWRPGTKTGYHSFTFGFLVGEIARRVTGKPIRQLLREWVTAPLGIDGDLYFGVPRTDLARLARLEDAVPPPVAPPEGDAILAPWELRPTAAMGNSHETLQADIPSVGTFTARGAAAMNASVLDGRLIDSHQLEELTAVAFEGTDQVFGNHARLALGYPLGRIGTQPDEAPTTFGWVGGGGSYVYADTATGTSFAMTKTRLTPHFNTAQRLADLTTAEIDPPA